MALLTIAPPASEPVTLAQMKQYARVDFTDDDTLWPLLIAAAREWCEVYTQRRFVLRTMRLYMDFFPGYVDFKLAGQKVSSPFVSGSNAVLVGIRYAIALPYPRVRGIAQFLYQDQNGEPQQMIAATDYIQDIQSQPARLTPLFGSMWPVARVVANAVQVDYVTGYGGNIAVSTTANSTAISGYVFASGMAGLAISIPNAGTGGNTPLNTTIASVDSNGNGTLATQASSAVSSVQAYLGDPVPEAVQIAVLRLATYYYENRNYSPDKQFLDSVKAQLAPYRDLRL
ncbi:MAG TPA: head-tail connector protein [Acidobacteriaceae bacterium]|nr:head-tail connector protein [Acidobacteriaceae bacterium]